MRHSTMKKYKNAIDELAINAANNGIVLRNDFNTVIAKHQITKTLPYYLEKLNIIEQIERGKFKFLKTVTINDVKKLGNLQNTRISTIKQKNKIQMEINLHQESDDFATKAIAHLQSLGYKVQKVKHDLPIRQSQKHLLSAISDSKNFGNQNQLITKMKQLIDTIAEAEEKQIKHAFEMSRLHPTKTAEDYIKDEYILAK